ncbi:MAG: hypothetical protein IKE52_06375 [Mogibacterium sp.]|nr:hypothetical protein [Mogibacterium sp.]
MACFAVSAAEALIVKGIEKHSEKIEKAQLESGRANVDPTSADVSGAPKIPMSRKLRWLTWMLWGGSILLAYEHIWHGEIVPWFPFLTAMSSSADAAEMFHEMATVGVTMAVIITAVWFVMCKAADAIMSRKPEAAVQEL